MTAQLRGLLKVGEPRRFRLHAISLALALLALVLVVVAAIRADRGPSGQVMEILGRHMGQAVGRIVVALLLGWGAFLVLGRSNLVGNLVSCVFLGLSTLGFVPRHRGISRQDAAALRALKERAQREAGKQLALLDSGEATPNLRAYRHAMLNMEGAASGTSGAVRTIVECGIHMMRGWEQPMVQLDAADQRFQGLGGVDVSTVRERNDIGDRLSAVSVVAEAEGLLVGVLRNSQNTFERCLTERGVSEADRKEAAVGFAKAGSFLRQLAIHEGERDFTDAATTYFTLLDKHWGEWAPDADTDGFWAVFAKEGPAAEGKAAVDRMIEIGENVERLQREVLAGVVER